jgi:hypothetical protein
VQKPEQAATLQGVTNFAAAFRVDAAAVALAAAAGSRAFIFKPLIYKIFSQFGHGIAAPFSSACRRAPDFHNFCRCFKALRLYRWVFLPFPLTY